MTGQALVAAITASGKSIYDPIEVGSPELWFTAELLEEVLQAGLRGLSVQGLALRTRSKVVKQHAARILGYPVPPSFKRTQPRFPGQHFDTYVQVANNLQVWNEELDASRRYVVVRVDANGIIGRVRVITGAELGKFDTTGKITTKYQAKSTSFVDQVQLVTPSDTQCLIPLLGAVPSSGLLMSPTSKPISGEILPISEIFTRLTPLIGRSFADTGAIQERNRGAGLHKLVCAALGYQSSGDTGQFPDVPHQLLEVKLQTSPTIDLGLVLPSSQAPLDLPKLGGVQVRHCDVRYAVFYAETNHQEVTLKSLILSTGEGFFTRFSQFQGNVINGKLQILLPSDFFDC